MSNFSDKSTVIGSLVALFTGNSILGGAVMLAVDIVGGLTDSKEQKQAIEGHIRTEIMSANSIEHVEQLTERFYKEFAKHTEFIKHCADARIEALEIENKASTGFYDKVWLVIAVLTITGVLSLAYIGLSS